MKTLFSAGIFLLFITGCKKEDPCNLTVDSLAGSYKLTGLMYKPAPSLSEQNLFTDMEECRRDNIFIFNSDKTFIHQDIGTTCLPSETEQSAWDLDGTTLTIDNMVSNVTSFDCNTMQTTTTNYNIPGDLLIATYVRH